MINCDELPLVSVIVPVYKVEKYIKRCIESIINQTYKKLEIILIDDGSPDNCGKICDSFAAKDDRIIVIHKKNGGLSDARNVALKKCRGDYITCIDSDDWVSKWYVQNLYTALVRGNADISISGFENVIDDNKESSIATNELKGYECIDKKECFEKMLYQKGVETSAWGKLYRREIIVDLEYPVGKLYEDIPVTTEAIKRSKIIAVISNVDYYYVQRSNSIQYEIFSHRKMDAINHIIELQHFINKEYMELSDAAKCKTFCVACNLILGIENPKKHSADYTFLWNIIKDNRLSVVRNNKARKKARIAACISFSGCFFLKFVYKYTQIRGKQHENSANSR